MTFASLIDRDRVSELQLQLGDDAFGEVVDLILGELRANMDELPGMPAGRPLADALHSLRGSALNLGMTSLAARCREDEQRQRNAPAAFDLAEFSEIIEKSAAALQSYSEKQNSL